MDMTVASLFKHKMRFTFRSTHTDIEEPGCFVRTHYYNSPIIENVESLGLNDVNDLCTILCKPLVLYAFSKIIHEDHVIPIDKIEIMAGVADFEEGNDYNLQIYSFINPLEYHELFFSHADVASQLFPERLLKERTLIFVDVRCYYYVESLAEEVRFRAEFNYHAHWRLPYPIEEYLYLVHDNEISNEWQELESIDDKFYNPPIEPYTPPIEAHREDCCVACFEAKPNILYLNCLHMAICDSCDRLKKTHRKNCDMCRAEIFKRVKI